MIVYGEYTQEELDSQYNQRTLVPDSARITDAWTVKGEEARRSLTCELGVPYNDHPDECLDIFPAGEQAPVLLYLHGGAWTRRSKSDAGYIAPAMVRSGVSLVGVDFTLAPEASLDRMVRQCREAVIWVSKHADRWGADPSRLHVVGHSSGGHLAGMVLTTDWERDYGMPKDIVKSVAAISGMYDLEPVRLSYRNQYLGLDEIAVQQNSPIKRIRPLDCGLVVGYGDGELDEFQRQSAAFIDAWRQAGNVCVDIVGRGRNHFEMGDDLADPETELFAAILSQVRGS